MTYQQAEKHPRPWERISDYHSKGRPMSDKEKERLLKKIKQRAAKK